MNVADVERDGMAQYARAQERRWAHRAEAISTATAVLCSAHPEYDEWGTRKRVAKQYDEWFP